jgi:hypothetical protein
MTQKCTYRVAVCAHQVALRNLTENSRLAVTADQVRDICGLRRPGPVVPLHRRGVKDPAAVRAGPSLLQTGVPGDKRSVQDLLLSHPRGPRRTVVRGVVGPPARLAPRLMA